LKKRPSKAERKRRKQERQRLLLLSREERVERRRQRKLQQRVGRFLLRQQLLHEQGWQCYLCGCSLNERRRPTIDHVVPKSRGGSNATCNLRIACEPCNGSKSDWKYSEMVLGFRMDRS